MVKYMTTRIIDGYLNYEELFALDKNKKYQDEVDKMLIEEGCEHLIKRG